MAWNIVYGVPNIILTPGAGAVVTQGITSMMSQGMIISPPGAALSLGGLSPLLAPLRPPGGALSMIGLNPTVSVSGSPGLSYTLPSNRITAWKPGISYCPTSGPGAPTNAPAGWSGGLPSALYTQFGTTISPSGGDDTATINAAITAAGNVASVLAPRFVLLSAGTFIESGNGIRILPSYVILRGAGPGPGMKGALATVPTTGGTFLIKSDGLTNPAPNISIGTRAQGGGAVGLNTMGSTLNLTADAVAGLSSVALASVAGLSIGKIVYINELYDSSGTLTWYNTSGNQAGSSTGFNGWAEGADSLFGLSRPIGQAMEVQAINGLTVTFTTPFHTTYRTSQTAHVGIPNLGGATQTVWSGVENIFTTGGDGGDGGGNVIINGGAYNWVTNIESSGHGPKFGGALVHLYSCFRCELSGSYLHSNAADIDRISPGGGYYNIVLDAYAADNLVENNISWIANKVLVMRGTGGGNVIGYNYMDDGYGITYMNQMETALNADHMTTSQKELLEGNYSWQLGTDSRWGNSIFITWFRNWGSSFRVSAWPSLIPSTSCAFGNPLLNKSTGASPNVFYEDVFNRNPCKIGSHHWGSNYLGNILGVPSNMLLSSPRSGSVPSQTGWNYEWYPPSSPAALSQALIPIFQFGSPDGSEPSFPNNHLDPSVLPLTLRDANFDYFTGLSHWHGIAGVATSFSTGAGAVTPPGASASGGIVLPNSLYQASKPVFFHANVWPAYDGSNAANPQPGVMPAKARFEAGVPNTI